MSLPVGGSELEEEVLVVGALVGGSKERTDQVGVDRRRLDIASWASASASSSGFALALVLAALSVSALALRQQGRAFGCGPGALLVPDGVCCWFRNVSHGDPVCSCPTTRQLLLLVDIF